MKKNYNNDWFIDKSKIIHRDNYDYSLVEYIKSTIPVKIICKYHGVFEQLPQNHLKGKGCKYCANNVKLTNEEFIKKSQYIHKNKYNYSKCNYINNRTLVIIVCKKHGDFKCFPGNHLRGVQCEKCAIEKRSNKQRLSVECFINKSSKIHNNFFDYSNVVYINNRTNVEIICPIHGKFYQNPGHHMDGVGCSKCAVTKNSKKLKLNINVFLSNAHKIHGNLYDYSQSVYNGCKIKIKIICKKHGIFLQTPQNHITSKQGCPKCKCSKGEREIIKFLENINLNYDYQKRFHDCKYKKYLIFDFYISEKNICIEFDGKQHFDPIFYFGGKKGLESTQERDEIKNKYCESKNIKLIRIRYDEDINEILRKNLKII